MNRRYRALAGIAVIAVGAMGCDGGGSLTEKPDFTGKTVGPPPLPPNIPRPGQSPAPAKPADTAPAEAPKQ
jgi:hypothetical protein